MGDVEMRAAKSSEKQAFANYPDGSQRGSQGGE